MGVKSLGASSEGRQVGSREAPTLRRQHWHDSRGWKKFWPNLNQSKRPHQTTTTTCIIISVAAPSVIISAGGWLVALPSVVAITPVATRRRRWQLPLDVWFGLFVCGVQVAAGAQLAVARVAQHTDGPHLAGRLTKTLLSPPLH